MKVIWFDSALQDEGVDVQIIRVWLFLQFWWRFIIFVIVFISWAVSCALFLCRTSLLNSFILQSRSEISEILLIHIWFFIREESWLIESWFSIHFPGFRILQNERGREQTASSHGHGKEAEACKPQYSGSRQDERDSSLRLWQDQEQEGDPVNWVAAIGVLMGMQTK